MASRPTSATGSGKPTTSSTKPPAKSAKAGRPGPPVRGKGSRRPGPPPPVRRQRSWGMIAATAAVALFAVAVLAYAVHSNNEAKKPVSIKGVSSHTYAGGQHVKANEKVSYDVTPPDGGKHDGSQWADCTGTVYTTQIRNEDAVHSLEHGAVWITYRPDLSKGDIAKLAKLVDGKAYSMMSPYPGLDKAVSVQAWGKQLQVSSASDKRIAKFVEAYRSPKGSAPESGGSCGNPTFKAKPLAPLT